MPNLSNDFEVRKETLRALGGDPTGLSNIFEVDKEILRLTQQGGSGIPDAPIDGVQYARQNGEWTPVESGLDWNTIKQKLAEDGVESIKFIMGNEQVILTASELKTLLNQTVLPDAPSDGQQYARQNGEWTPVESVEPGIQDAPSDGKTYGRNNGTWTPVEEGLTDAPSDGKTYGRNNSTWTEVETGIQDAPLDGKTYGRNNSTWTEVETGIQDAPLDGKTYGRNNSTWTEVETGIQDAPLDGQQYARQNGEWKPVQIPTVEKYLTITADESNTGETIIHPNIEGSLPNLNLQYRINNGKWTDFIVGTTADIKIGAGDVLQFKGENPEGVSTNSGNNTLNFGISGNPVALSGNIMSLIDGVGDALEIPNDYCFSTLFRNSAIKTVSSDFLPATTLKTSCYRDLFSGCRNLTQAPDLPATTLATDCYYGMFYSCKLLTTAPELPAKVLLDGCYGYMFTYCNSLNYVKCLATEGTINGDGTVPSALNNWLEGVASTGTFEKLSGVSYEAGGHHGIPEGWTVKEIYEYVEAPLDGNQYARQNGTWTVVEPGISDAPSDGKTYGRNNGTWAPVESGGSVIPEGKYMTITVDKSNSGETVISPTVTGTLSPNLQYRINNGSWTDFVVGTTADIHVVAGDFVQFKGNNPSGISAYNNYLNFSISNLCHLSGNVMSLIDGVGETLIIPNDYCFYRLFFNSNVKTVSKDFLPAITLKNNCYEKMFRECQNLTNTPELPSTTLSSGCYNEMFIECHNLTQAPELPATTLEYNCYHGMFQGCSNLVKAPEILPATTLAEHCYESMFSGCINLTKAPVLPSKTLVDSCYYFMFDSCRKLNGVKSLAVEGLNNSSALGSWLNNVASSGTFEKPYGVVYPTGSIPTGWTVKDVDLYVEAPMDGNQYARQNAAWVEVSKVKTTNNTTMQFWSGTQQEYDAIATKDSHTLYIIK